MPVDILKHLGSCLRKARKERHLTQELLSEKTGISVRHIAKIEKGVMNPSFEVLYALVNTLEISTDYLFCPEIPDNEKKVQQMINCYNSCNPADRDILLNVIECLSSGLKNR